MLCRVVYYIVLYVYAAGGIFLADRRIYET